jgi:hypothetical protein
MPDRFEDQPFRAGAVVNGDIGIWDPLDVDREARHAFAITTCNGCHSSTETATPSNHILPIREGTDALSPFLRGITVPDFFTEPAADVQ